MSRRHRKAVPAYVAAAVVKVAGEAAGGLIRQCQGVCRSESANPAFHTAEGATAGGVGGHGRGCHGARLGYWPRSPPCCSPCGSWGWLRPRRRGPGHPLPARASALPGRWSSEHSRRVPAPDGSFLIYVGPGPNGDQLWMKRRDSYSALPIRRYRRGADIRHFARQQVDCARRERPTPEDPGRTAARRFPLVSDFVGGVFGARVARRRFDHLCHERRRRIDAGVRRRWDAARWCGTATR